MNFKKIILISTVLILFSSYFYFDLGNFLSLGYIKESQNSFQSHYLENPITTLLIFFIIYTLITAVSFPGAAVLTLLAGALFGIVVGTIVVSFASTIGATIAMLFSRYMFHDYVKEKLKKSYKKINDGIKKEGAFYLFTLRLVPIFPFFLINIAMGLTNMKLWTYYWISQIGMFAGTIVYVNAGSQLSNINSLSGILSFNIIVSFVILGVFPYIAKKSIEIYKNKSKNIIK